MSTKSKARRIAIEAVVEAISQQGFGRLEEEFGKIIHDAGQQLRDEFGEAVKDKIREYIKSPQFTKRVAKEMDAWLDNY